MNMVEFGYFFALALIAMVIAVHGARLRRVRRLVEGERTE